MFIIQMSSLLNHLIMSYEPLQIQLLLLHFLVFQSM